MRLIKWRDIHWDIVRRNLRSPWVLLGWPITVYAISLNHNAPIARLGTNENGTTRPIPYLEIKTPRRYPALTVGYRFNWNGILWFWRES